MTDLSKTAQAYAERAGWKVHPVGLNKHAILEDWPNTASDDVEQIDKWWAERPNASIGVVCGSRSGFWVLDIDLPDGPKNLERLEKEHGKLPKTLMQQTGSGGKQFFWKWNGTPIKNSTSKIAKNIDTRGEGGYVVVPPSPHPTGKKYKWLNKAEIAPPPEWLVKLILRPKDEPPQRNTYGQIALNNELSKLGMASIGSRNDTLNNAAYNLGQLVAGGELDYGAVYSSLLGVALSIGLKEKETKRTIESGMKAGALKPRTGKHNNFENLTDSDIDKCINDDSRQHLTTTDDGSLHHDDVLTTFCRHCDDTLTTNTEYSLADRIKDWVINSPGSFSNQDIDREFCLTTRKEKQNRSKILERLHMARKIKKDKRKKGTWHIVDDNIDFVDLDAEEPEAFPIVLPFGLHDHVMIPPKAIILLAGSSNAGKTAYILNTLKANLSQNYTRMYLMSEMGSGEYKTRIKNFGIGMSPWKKVKAASKSYDFDGAITHYNRDGLTCVDYLEEVEGEYHKIPTDIRNIYDALGNGVALVAIQKRTDQEYARGGQGTVEKARLVLNLDYICAGDRCIYCALKLVKVKHFLNRNLQGHEIHFRLENGCQIEPITDWMLSSKVNRKRIASQYEGGAAEDADDAVHFQLTTGKRVRIIARDINKWQETFSAIDVRNELLTIAQENMRNKFLTEKYFYQLPSILAKRNGKNDF